MLVKKTQHLALGELGSRIPLLLLEVTLARVLGPGVYGLWSIVQTFVTYGNFLHFGVVSSLARREPELLEKSKREELRSNRAIAYGFQILVILAVTVVVLLIYSVNPTVFDRVGGLACVLGLLSVILAQQITITAQASALNEYKIIAASIAKLTFAFGFLLLGLIAARFEAPIFWLTLSWSASLVVGLVVLHIKARGIFLQPRIDVSRTLSMLADGFPIMLQGLIRFGLMSVDKLTVFALAGPAQVGFYGVGSLGASVTGIFASMVARVSIPTLLRLRARQDSKQMMQTEFNRMLQLIQLLSFGAIFGICAFAPLFVKLAMPDYEPAVRVIGLLAITGGFTGLAQALSDVTMSLGVKAAILINTVIALLIEVMLLILAWTTVGGIEAVAVAVLGAMVFMCGRALWLGFHSVGYNLSDSRRKMGRLAQRAGIASGACLAALELQSFAITRFDSAPMFAIALNMLFLGLVGFSIRTATHFLRRYSNNG